MLGLLSIFLFFAFLVGLGFLLAAFALALFFNPLVAGFLWLIAAFLIGLVAFFSCWPMWVFAITGIVLILVGIVIGIALIFWVWNTFFNCERDDCRKRKNNHCKRCGRDDGKCGCMFDFGEIVSIRSKECCNTCDRPRSNCGCNKQRSCDRQQSCESQQPSCERQQHSGKHCKSGNCNQLLQEVANNTKFFLTKQEDGSCLLEQMIWDCNSQTWQVLYTAQVNQPVNSGSNLIPINA